MLYREIIAVCSQIHTKHIDTQCGQNVHFLSAKAGGAHRVSVRHNTLPALHYAQRALCDC